MDNVRSQYSWRRIRSEPRAPPSPATTSIRRGLRAPDRMSLHRPNRSRDAHTRCLEQMPNGASVIRGMTGDLEHRLAECWFVKSTPHLLFVGLDSATAPSTTSLTSEVRAALERSIQDEYRAETINQGVVEDLGPLAPFSGRGLRAPDRRLCRHHIRCALGLVCAGSVAVACSGPAVCFLRQSSLF